MALNGTGMDQQFRENSLNLKQQDSILDVDDVVASSAQQSQKTDQRGNKLEHAKQVGKKTVLDLQAVCTGLDSKITEIGLVVAQAQTYQGSAKFYHALGNLGIKWAKDKAAVMRHEKMQTLDLKQAIQEIQNLTVDTIRQLGESESEYKTDLQMYQTEITAILKKQTAATGPYLEIVAKRQALEGQVQAAKEELAAGTLEQAERPHKEEQLEALQRELHDAQLKEISLLSVVKEAKVMPDLQENRDAAAKAIQALHGMRQSMFEKWSNIKVVLERAPTAMKATSRLELYSSVDPALNKTFELVTGNNIASAGASLETYTERLKHAAIDPQKSQEFLNELLGHLNDFAKDLQDVEEGVKNHKAPSVPTASNDLN